jgi:spore coat polysaccharide biosynthesis protein SpsF
MTSEFSRTAPDRSASVVAIVQARMGSSRLPGKVLRDIGGRSMLARVVERLRRCDDIAAVVIATTDEPDDAAIVARARELDVPVVRGSRDDVLDRYLMAARAHGGDLLARVTSDCPLIDPQVSSHVIRRFLAADPAVDYASNKIPQSYPRGLDIEVFSRAALERTCREATHPYERTHVTPYMYERPERFRLLSVTDDVDRSWWRWTVDDRLGADGDFGWRDAIALIDREPSLLAINRHIVQKTLQEG